MNRHTAPMRALERPSSPRTVIRGAFGAPRDEAVGRRSGVSSRSIPPNALTRHGRPRAGHPPHPVRREISPLAACREPLSFSWMAASSAAMTGSPAGDQLQPWTRVESAHQKIHGDHPAERQLQVRRPAQQLRLATHRRQQRHDGEGRRGREAEPESATPRSVAARMS